MTPRESARAHLPELDATFDALKARFGASLVHLRTPDGEWGREPEWTRWPSHSAADMAREAWRPDVPREAAPPLTAGRKQRR